MYESVAKLPGYHVAKLLATARIANDDSLWLFCILFCCSCVKPFDMVLVLSFKPVVSTSAQVSEM